MHRTVTYSAKNAYCFISGTIKNLNLTEGTTGQYLKTVFITECFEVVKMSMVGMYAFLHNHLSSI